MYRLAVLEGLVREETQLETQLLNFINWRRNTSSQAEGVDPSPPAWLGKTLAMLVFPPSLTSSLFFTANHDLLSQRGVKLSLPTWLDNIWDNLEW